jgi:hypothetical protein
MKINPNVKYCVDVFDIKLFYVDQKKTVVLSYPEAVVWDLMIKKYSIRRMYHVMAIIGRMTPAHAKAVVDDALHFFYTENILLGD